MGNSDPEPQEILTTLLDRSLALVTDVEAIDEDLRKLFAETTLSRVDQRQNQLMRSQVNQGGRRLLRDSG